MNHRRQFGPRVLHVITPSRMAGAETFLARLIRRTRGSAITHRCVTSRSAANTELRAAGIEFEALGIGGKLNPLAMPRLVGAIRRHGIELVHSHLSTASWWSGWLEQLGGPPSIGHVHGFTSAIWHRWQSHLVACSAAVKEHMVAEGIRAERLSVLHYPVDADDVMPTRSAAAVRAELGADRDAPIVGTFAHLSPKKGHRELVRAAQIVLDRVPQAQFWCFGEGPLRAELEETARELGVAKSFKLFGFRRDVPDLMHSVDIMCLPSRCEPFGLVYVEAALAEKPVIACNAGGAREIIEHGETGLLIPPPKPPAANMPASNIAALAESILTLLENRDQAAAMGRRGRELALERFGWRQYLSRLTEVYQRVLNESYVGAASVPDRDAA
jgi:glycosyltransferase involved in cell wall biosynthesis